MKICIKKTAVEFELTIEVAAWVAVLFFNFKL